MKIRKIFAVLLLAAMFVPILSSCSTYGRRALRVGVSVSFGRDGMDVFTAAVVTEGDGSVHSCEIRGEGYHCDLFDSGEEPDGGFDTPIIDLSDEEAQAPTVTVTEFNADKNATVAEIETLVKGKTLADIQAMLGKDENDPYDYERDPMKDAMLSAVERALLKDVFVNFRSGDDFTVGVSYMPTVTPSYSDDGLPLVSISVNVGAVALGYDKVVRCASIDSFVASFGAIRDEDGSIKADVSYQGTKGEQGDDYGMVAYAGAIAEWYVQAQTYANTAIGKSVDEVADIPEFNVAGCTMYVAVYKPALVSAAQSAADK